MIQLFSLLFAKSIHVIQRSNDDQAAGNRWRCQNDFVRFVTCDLHILPASAHDLHVTVFTGEIQAAVGRRPPPETR